MRITQLVYYVKTIECGSITKAARELYVSQPALTKAISSLESEFSVHLIDREARGVRITPVGREFYIYAKEVIAASENLKNAFRPKRGKAGTHLRVCSQQFEFLYDLFDQVYQSATGPINIDLIEADRSAVIETVHEHKANIGLLVTTEMDSIIFKNELQKQPLEIHPLATSGVYVSMCPSSPLYHKEMVSIKDTSQCLHVVLDMDQMTRIGMHTSQIHYYVDNKNLIFCNSIRACCHFMEKHGALLYTPKWVNGIITAKDVRTIPLLMDDGTPYPHRNQLVWIKRESEIFSPIENQFIQFLQNRFPAG